MRHYTLIWSLLLPALCGCSRPELPPAAILQKLPTADRVVVTNRFLGFGTNIAGEGVGRLAKAVSTAEHPKDGAAAMFDLDMAFYSGTNFLFAIRLQDEAFLLEDREYDDRSGVLKAFYLKLEEPFGTR